MFSQTTVYVLKDCLHHHQCTMTPVLLRFLHPSGVGGFSECLCACFEVEFNSALALDLSHSLIFLPLCCTFNFSSFALLLLFPVSISVTPTELPGCSDGEEVLPGINTHTFTNFLVRFTPLSSVHPQTSCLPPEASQLPLMNTSQGVNTRAVLDRKATHKGK